jgi:two-component system aerobic respiration control sensor histidine kinase ArcB
MAVQIEREIFSRKSPKIKSLNILIVEDEPIALAVNLRLLEAMGYAPDVAVNGEQALAMLANRYDLIFMDIGLPDMNGIEVAAEIRRRELQHHTCIIALTGYSLVEVREKCLEAGVNEVAQKPISYAALQEQIDRFF